VVRLGPLAVGAAVGGAGVAAGGVAGREAGRHLSGGRPPLPLGPVHVWGSGPARPPAPLPAANRPTANRQPAAPTSQPPNRPQDDAYSPAVRSREYTPALAPALVAKRPAELRPSVPLSSALFLRPPPPLALLEGGAFGGGGFGGGGSGQLQPVGLQLQLAAAAGDRGGPSPGRQRQQHPGGGPAGAGGPGGAAAPLPPGFQLQPQQRQLLGRLPDWNGARQHLTGLDVVASGLGVGAGAGAGRPGQDSLSLLPPGVQVRAGGAGGVRALCFIYIVGGRGGGGGSWTGGGG
jgi:hypothetical protein